VLGWKEHVKKEKMAERMEIMTRKKKKN